MQIENSQLIQKSNYGRKRFEKNSETNKEVINEGQFCHKQFCHAILTSPLFFCWAAQIAEKNNYLVRLKGLENYFLLRISKAHKKISE
jgi:hypothetical protein